jgi:hypothetical protein
MIIWRYGIMGEGIDWTNLDQWIGERTMKAEMPDAPAALRKALEDFIAKLV